MKKFLGVVLIILILTGCTNEKEIQEDTQEIKEQQEENVLLEEKNQLPAFDSIEHPIILLNNQVGYDSIYQQVCWIDCSEEEKLNHQFHKIIKDNIGDVINVKWDQMTPAPDKVEIKEYTTEFNQIGETSTISDEQKNFQINVTDSSFDKIYEVIFVWEDSGSAIGKSRLAFVVNN